MRHLFIAILLLCTLTANAQTPPVEVTLNDLMRDIMQTTSEGKNSKIVLWFPQEFWDVAAASDPSFKKSMVDMIKDAFSDYTIVVAVDADRTSPGEHTYPTYAEMKKEMKLVDGTMQEYVPLEDKELSTIALQFKEAIAPVFAKMIGDMGSHAYLFFFKTKGNTNTASKNGSMKITVDKTTFLWSLPLASMAPPKYCPVDNQKMQGNWLYCPFHGAKLGAK